MLDADFLLYPGGFVAGPMVEAGWGEPISYVTARLGILIVSAGPEDHHPRRIAAGLADT